MAAHSPLTTVVPPVAPDQPPAAWPQWLRSMAEAINLLANYQNNPTPEALDIAELQQLAADLSVRLEALERAVTLDTWELHGFLPEQEPDKATVRLPPLDEILNHWPQIEAHLKKATGRTGCYEPIDLLRLAFAGAVGIWLCEGKHGIDAVVVTEVKQYPRKRILDVLFAGGTNMGNWMPELRTAIDQHARQTGCDHIASICRPGWIRAWGGRATGDIVVVRGLGEP